ncbi:hypothetical protein KBB96_10285 [Luteolibacter ambystomatis]|uniref:Uncharacterized protein n=1 Tax=Luteolibacter ambystomatis TaxID=2824561 RepID=A0A975IXF3_9BACT|nr:hypothetical protein [Luteolibacter ambystomatis]QUE49261.1 hypothetical protein KBB96_10285 [Luteolibacter ambystomatis]
MSERTPATNASPWTRLKLVPCDPASDAGSSGGKEGTIGEAGSGGTETVLSTSPSGTTKVV